MNPVLVDAAIKATDEYKNSLNENLELAKNLVSRYEMRCKEAAVSTIKLLFSIGKTSISTMISYY